MEAKKEYVARTRSDGRQEQRRARSAATPPMLNFRKRSPAARHRTKFHGGLRARRFPARCLVKEFAEEAIRDHWIKNMTWRQLHEKHAKLCLDEPTCF